MRNQVSIVKNEMSEAQKIKMVFDNDRYSSTFKVLKKVVLALVITLQFLITTIFIFNYSVGEHPETEIGIRLLTSLVQSALATVVLDYVVSGICKFLASGETLSDYFVRLLNIDREESDYDDDEYDDNEDDEYSFEENDKEEIYSACTFRVQNAREKSNVIYISNYKK